MNQRGIVALEGNTMRPVVIRRGTVAPLFTGHGSLSRVHGRHVMEE